MLLPPQFDKLHVCVCRESLSVTSIQAKCKDECFYVHWHAQVQLVLLGTLCARREGAF